MHDPDHEHNMDSIPSFISTDIRGDGWLIQPLLMPPTPRHTMFASHSLICVEQYNGPGEIAAYQPVCLASSEAEAIFIISHDYRRRTPENGDLYPEGYALWTRNANGHYQRAAEISRA